MNVKIMSTFLVKESLQRLPADLGNAQIFGAAIDSQGSE